MVPLLTNPHIIVSKYSSETCLYKAVNHFIQSSVDTLATCAICNLITEQPNAAQHRKAPRHTHIQTPTTGTRVLRQISCNSLRWFYSNLAHTNTWLQTFAVTCYHTHTPMHGIACMCVQDLGTMNVRQLVLQQNSLAFQLVLQQSTASNAVQLYFAQINSADCDAANRNPYNANQICFRHDDNAHDEIINYGRSFPPVCLCVWEKEVHWWIARDLRLAYDFRRTLFVWLLLLP